jgi:hypothetical protein
VIEQAETLEHLFARGMFVEKLAFGYDLAKLRITKA